MKFCTKCGVGKPTSEYYVKRKCKDGLYPTCKQCVSEYQRVHYAKNADRIKASVAAYAKANPEKIAEYQKKIYQADKGTAIAKAKVWAKENRPARSRINAKYERANREKISARNKARIAALRLVDPTLIREQGRRAQALRRSRVASAGGRISQESWDAIFAIIETKACLYCGNTDSPLTMDHWIPVSRGGRTSAGNLLPCCKSCNSKKFNKSPKQWCEEIGAKQEEFEAFLWATSAALGGEISPEIAARYEDA